MSLEFLISDLAADGWLKSQSMCICW